MRVTGGVLRGRRVLMPDGPVRPTQDRVREALFSMLGESVLGVRFLDLFAGSGVVGLEAWSRGAAFVCWVESSRRVLPSLEENVKRLCDGRTRVVRDESLRFLKKKVVTGPYGIIFADPPFRKNLRRQRAQGRSAAGDWRQRRQAGAHGLGTEDLGLPPDRGWLHLLIEGIEEGQLLSQGGLFILESDKDDRESLPSGWSAVKEKLYGGCRLQFLRKAERNG